MIWIITCYPEVSNYTEMMLQAQVQLEYKAEHKPNKWVVYKVQ